MPDVQAAWDRFDDHGDSEWLKSALPKTLAGKAAEAAESLLLASIRLQQLGDALLDVSLIFSHDSLAVVDFHSGENALLPAGFWLLKQGVGPCWRIWQLA